MAGSGLNDLRVLVVDDNKHMRMLLRTLLRAVNIRHVVEASNGAEALKEMASFSPQVILADWNMEPVDGITLARRLRVGQDSPNPFVPIILISAHAELHRVIEARDAGVDEFLSKPVSPKVLYSRLLTVIERPRNFIRTATYCGPDRRRKDRPFRGVDRRRKVVVPPVSRESLASLLQP